MNLLWEKWCFQWQLNSWNSLVSWKLKRCPNRNNNPQRATRWRGKNDTDQGDSQKTRTPKLLSHQKCQPKIHQVLPIHQKSIGSMGLVDLPTWMVDLYCKFLNFVGEYTRPMDPQYRMNLETLVKVLIFCFVKDLVYNSALCLPRSCPTRRPKMVSWKKLWKSSMARHAVLLLQVVGRLILTSRCFWTKKSSGFTAFFGLFKMMFYGFYHSKSP